MLHVAMKKPSGKTPYDLMRATFPAGKVSGAPKIRAMQLISKLRGIPQAGRGPFPQTRETSNAQPSTSDIEMELQNDSEPEVEFQETVNKSKAMLKAVALAETFGARRET
jgi:anthranilate synthase component I